MHTLAISEQGTTLHAEGDLLTLSRGQHEVRRVRVGEVDQLLLLGRIELSSGCLALLLRRSVDVVWLTQQGLFRGRLTGRSTRNVVLRLKQYQRSLDPAFCARVTQALVAGKIRQQRQVLLRAQRQLRDNDLAADLAQLRQLGERTQGVADLDVLRGLEGRAAAIYFGHFDRLLKTREFRFTGRNRRPPRDPVNSLLSFGYAVLGSLLETEVNRCGLDPMLGFFHQPAYGRPSLMLDLLEEFRTVVDTLVLRVLNRRQLGPGDFVRRSGKDLITILNDEGTAAPSATAESCVPADGTPPWEESPQQESEPTTPPDRRPAAPESRTGPNTDSGNGRTQGAEASATMPNSTLAVPNQGTAADVVGVYLADTGRKIFLNELFRRTRETLYYPPRDATLELRDIIRQQVYQMARVIQGEQEQYEPFLSE